MFALGGKYLTTGLRTRKVTYSRTIRCDDAATLDKKYIVVYIYNNNNNMTFWFNNP